MLRYIGLVCMLWMGCNAHAQIIKGSVADVLGNPVLYGSVLMKSQDSTGRFLGVTTIREGVYSISLSNSVDKVALIVQVYSFQKGYAEIHLTNQDSVIQQDFVLNPISVVELKEVIVSEEGYPFQIKEDTVVFDTEDYLTPASRKLEDVIANLPGMEVTDGGAIKYHGKLIETVTIEGDNLFGGNYVVGTRNINPDIVAQIEAIDNYQENPLLAGVSASNKVALNLVLKEGRTDLSGNVNLIGGLTLPEPEIRYSGSITVLALRSNMKTFVNGALNNIGQNRNPFPLNAAAEEKTEDRDLTMRPPISTPQIGGITDESRIRLNQELFGSANAIFNVSPKIRIRTNFFADTDKVTAEQTLRSETYLSNDSIVWINNLQTLRRPTLYRGDFQLQYKTSATSLLEYSAKVMSITTLAESSIQNNHLTNQKGILTTTDFFYKQKLLFTQKFANARVLQVSLTQADHRLDQQYTLSPPIFDSATFSLNRQGAELARQTVKGQVSYLGAHERGTFKFDLAGKHQSQPLTSVFQGIDTLAEISVPYSIANLMYTSGSISGEGLVNFQLGLLQLAPSMRLTWLNQRYEDNTDGLTENRQSILPQPKLLAKAQLGEFVRLQGIYSYSQQPLTQQYLINAPFLANNRNLKVFEPSLALQQSSNLFLNFLYSNLYNDFNFRLGFNLQDTKGAFLEQIELSELLTQTRYFFEGVRLQRRNLDANLSAYFDALGTTFQIRSSTNYLNYFNRFNSQELRENTVWVENIEGTLKTGLDHWHLVNSVLWSWSRAQARGTQAYINQSLVVASEVAYVPTPAWRLILDGNWIVPNLNTPTTNNLFLDFTIAYGTRGLPYELGVGVRNLTNTKRYEVVQTSDFNLLVQRTNVQPRSLFLVFNYEF